MHEVEPDLIDPRRLIDEAVDFLNEALTRLDAAMAHQAAALVDHAINILDDWAVDTIESGKTISAELN